MKEIWKEIKNYEMYEVSNLGNFRSKFDRKENEKYREIKGTLSSSGYQNIFLTGKNGKKISCKAHRLVAEAFIENPEKKRTVNHKDGDKHNNVASNLEWATYQENSQHACDTGLNPRQSGEKNSMSKISEEECIQLIIDMLDGANNNELALKYNLHSRYISLIRGKKRWKHLWENMFKNMSPTMSHTLYKNELDVDTQIIIINRIKNGEALKQLSIEYSVDRSILSRVKNNKTWKYAYEILNKRNAQRLSKAPLKEW